MQFVHNTISLPKITMLPSVNGRRYYVTPDKNKYPSITTILGHKEKPWLENWKNALGVEKADKETKRCAERGTAIHKMVERYLNNESKITTDQKPEHISGFNQLKSKLNRINNIHTQEAGLYSDILKVAGTTDCVAEYDGVLSIVDFKTSNNNKERSMIEDYFIQCTFYAIAYHERTNVAVEDIAILMTVEKGLAPLIFKEKIDKYVPKLLKRIDDYNKGVQ